MAVADWSGQDWALALGGVSVLIAAVTNSITGMVTLRRLGHVAEKVDGLLDKRVAAAEDTGNLAGRHELRVEQKQRMDDATDAKIRIAEAEHPK